MYVPNKGDRVFVTYAEGSVSTGVCIDAGYGGSIQYGVVDHVPAVDIEFDHVPGEPYGFELWDMAWREIGSITEPVLIGRIE